MCMCLCTGYRTDKTKRRGLHMISMCICTWYRIEKLGLYRLFMCKCICYKPVIDVHVIGLTLQTDECYIGCVCVYIRVIGLTR